MVTREDVVRSVKHRRVNQAMIQFPIEEREEEDYEKMGRKMTETTEVCGCRETRPEACGWIETNREDKLRNVQTCTRSTTY